ncbi:MAG: hypothetical protein AABX82_05105 [Nanoarchaeota archaeon]
MQERILFDTNIYGLLLEDKEFFNIVTPLISSSFIIYGSPLICKELRDLSTQAEFKGKNKRILLLTIYDSIIRKENHNLHIDDLVLLIAHKYFERYKIGGGQLSIHELLSDFSLIALASLHKLDVVISDDKRTMFSEKAKQTYREVNRRYNFHIPILYNYNSFKEYTKRCQMR